MSVAKKNVVLCDLDHTLFLTFWRDDMIGGPGGWDAYEQAAKDDPASPEMVALIDVLIRSGAYEVWGLTARPEKYRSITVRRFVDCGVRIEGLIMRPHGNFQKSPEVKLAQARSIFGENLSRVALVIEDRDDVCAVFRALGIVVLQCHLSAAPAPSVPYQEEQS